MKRFFIALLAGLIALSACTPEGPSRPVLDFTAEDFIGSRYALEHGMFTEFITFWDHPYETGEGYYFSYQTRHSDGTSTCEYGWWNIDKNGFFQIGHCYPVAWVEPWQELPNILPFRMVVNRRSEPEPATFYRVKNFDMLADGNNPYYLDAFVEYLDKNYTEDND